MRNQSETPSSGCRQPEAAVCSSTTGLPPWTTGRLATAVGEVLQVATSLRFADRFGAFKARWNIGRMHYAIGPGLYAVGRPCSSSPLLVSANYKMSFDRLRSELIRRDVWILVLDTQGINVWCAAGKGTFGTPELLRRIEASRLQELVSHRTLILPQLGAPGVAAYEVERRTGFRVVYGPVRASDLPAFLDAGMTATPAMRRVTFTIKDRLVLTPIELVLGWKVLLLAATLFLVLGGWGRGGYSWDEVSRGGFGAVRMFLLAYFGGAFLTPLLLPWLPGRAFSIKGATVGCFLTAIYAARAWETPMSSSSSLDLLAWSMLLPAVSAFFAMNFTGASTYTSPSGVRKEVRVALPAQMVAIGIGMVCWMVSRFV